MGEYLEETGDVQTQWPLRSVEDVKANVKGALISGPFGSNISAKYFTDSGVPVIRGNNLALDVGVRFKDEGFVFISVDKADELKTWAQPGDLIFTAVGTLGQVGYLSGNEAFPRYIISNKQIRLRLDTEKLLPLFAYYWFASPQMVDLIQQRNTGSSVPLINLGVVRSLPVPVPDIKVQEDITSVLSSLDAKIDLLHRQNKTLEAMAETLFRQWFVEEAEEGWEEFVLTDIASHCKVSVNPGKHPTRTYHHYSLPAYDEGRSPSLELGETIMSSKYVVPENAVLVSKLNPRFPRVWPIRNRKHEHPISSTEFQVFVPKQAEMFGFLYCFLISKPVQDELASVSSGTSGSHQRVSPDDIKGLTFLAKSKQQLVDFSKVVDPMLEKIEANKDQVASLTALRDTLLPKVMSGEVRVEMNEVVQN